MQWLYTCEKGINECCNNYNISIHLKAVEIIIHLKQIHSTFYSPFSLCQQSLQECHTHIHTILHLSDETKTISIALALFDRLSNRLRAEIHIDGKIIVT